MQTARTLILFLAMAAALAGCVAPETSDATLIRPDGSPVPAPSCQTNVAPWAWTNTVEAVQ